MAGAKASLWAEFMGIAAGLDVYVDVLMTWDPFFMPRAARGRTVVRVLRAARDRRASGHLDAGVRRPATIDLALVSFEVDFGAEIARPGPPPIAEFLSGQLALPAKRTGDGARVRTFSTQTSPGCSGSSS